MPDPKGFAPFYVLFTGKQNLLGELFQYYVRIISFDEFIACDEWTCISCYDV